MAGVGAAPAAASTVSATLLQRWNNTSFFKYFISFCMDIFIVQRIDLDFRSTRYKQSILLLQHTDKDYQTAVMNFSQSNQCI